MNPDELPREELRLYFMDQFLEQSWLLGSLIREGKGETSSAAFDMIAPREFGDVRLRTVAEALARLADRGPRFDSIDVLREIQRMERLGALGPNPVAAIARLQDGIYRGADWRALARKAARKRRERRARAVLSELAQQASGMHLGALRVEVARLQDLLANVPEGGTLGHDGRDEA